jgi:hypothetical protein
LPVSWRTRPALEGKWSSEKDSSEFVPFLSSHLALFFGPVRNLQPSRSPHSCRDARAQIELPQNRGLQRRAWWRWRPLGCRFVRGQPQSKRRPNPTPSPSGRVKPFRGHHTTPRRPPQWLPRAASEVAEDREPVEAARFAVTLRVFAVLPLSQRGRPQNAMQAARSSRSPLGLSFSTRPLRLSQATPYAAPFFVVPRIPICMVRLCVLLSH